MYAGKLCKIFRISLLISTIFCLPVFAQELPFGDQNLLSADVLNPNTVFSADLDGDGDKDVIVGAVGEYASYDLDPLIWYENLDGLGEYGPPHIVYAGLSMTVGYVLAADLDNDGDNDIIAASNYGGTLFWLENTDGTGIFGNYTEITTDMETPTCLSVGDLDGDNDLDIVSSSRDDFKIAWYENTDGMGTFGAQQILTTEARHATCVSIADIDGDDDLDIIYTAPYFDDLSWFENEDGAGSFSDVQTITTNIERPNSVDCADIDGDDDLDLVVTSVASNEYVYWFENNGSGSFGQRHTIFNNPWYPSGVVCADVDNDGDYDVVYGSDFTQHLAWCENLDGQGNFGTEQLITTYLDTPEWVICDDLDNDNDLDILSYGNQNNYDNVAWFENDGSGNFSSQIIVNLSTLEASAVISADLDGDGDNDVIAGAGGCGRLGWFENLDGHGKFGRQNIITDEAGIVISIQAYDIDGDNDIDIVLPNHENAGIKWFENIDGAGDFSTEHVVYGGPALSPFMVYVADMDNDDDPDIVATMYLQGKVTWFENLDGNGTYSDYQTIGIDLDFAYGVFCADLDGDGDNDVIAASYYDDKIVWYENTDGNGSFGPEIIIDSDMEYAQLVSAADIDGDGDMDVLASKCSSPSISWYENTDGNATFAAGQLVSSYNNGPCTIVPVDLDSDNDLDILTGSYSYLNDGVSWCANLDGQGDFSERILINNTVFNPFSVAASDLDGDGDLDVMSASYDDGKITWFENGFEGAEPQDFNLISPEDESIVTVLDVQLQWEEAVDPDNNITEYRIYISDDEATVLDSVYARILATEYTFTGINGETYWWTISAIDGHYNQAWALQTFSFTIDYDGIENENPTGLPLEYEITSVYPNPFNPVTNINIALPKSSDLSLIVYNLLGQKVVVLNNGKLNAGYHNFTFNGENLSSGIYFVKAYVTGKMDVKKKVILAK